MFASSKGKPKGPAWLGSGGAKGPKRKSAEWKPSAARQHDPESKQRAMRVLVAVTAAVLLAGFLYYLLTRPQKTPLIVFRSGAYPMQMPPLALAAEDEELLGKISTNLQVLPVELQSAGSLESLRKTLAGASRRFNPFQRGSKAALIYVAAHGVVDEGGRACLAPPGCDPFDSSTWLPLADVLDTISEDAGLRGRDKLLLLDCQRVWSCWRCGWLENRFFEELAAAVKAQGDPRLYVITAAGSGEVAWAAPELRGSVFGHFVARGLRGEASGSANAVTLGSLYRYVAAEVNGYSQKRRGVVQQPALLHLDAVYRPDSSGELPIPKGHAVLRMDLPLCHIDQARRQKMLSELQSGFDFDPLSEFKKTIGDTTLAAKPGESADASLARVWELYERRQRGRSSGEGDALPGFALDPVAWSSIQQRLAAVGERLLAGKQYQNADLQAEIAQLTKELEDDEFWKPEGGLPRLSLMQVKEDAKQAGSRASAANAFLAYVKAEPDKREEAVPRGLTRARAVRDVYQALASPAASGDMRAQLATAAEFLQRAAPVEASADLIEGHFLNLLHRGLAADAPLPSSRLTNVLATREAAERAALPRDLRAHYAIETLVTTADQRRRQAEDALFLMGAEETSGAVGASAAVYEEALSRGKRLMDFLRLRDEVWADLPLVAEWHLMRSSLAGEPPPVGRLTAVLERSIDLDDAVERVLRTREEMSPFAAPLERCERVYAELSPIWQNLKQELTGVYERPTSVERAYQRPDDLRQAEIALRWAPLVGDLGQFLERYLETLGGNTAGGQSVAAVKSAPPAKQNDEIFRELHRALHYEFIDPYEQHGRSTSWDEKKGADVIYRSGDRAGLPAWERLKGLLDQYTRAIAAEPLVWGRNQPAYAASARLRQWDRRVRVASAWLSSFQPHLRRPRQPTPARWLQEYDAAHVTAWHAYRALHDFWGNGEANATGGVPFFAAAVGRCDAVLPDRLRPLQYDVPGGAFADFAEQGPTNLQALRAWDPIEFPRSFNISSGGNGDARLDVAVQSSGPSSPWLPPGTAALSMVPSAGATQQPRAAFDTSGEKRAEAVELPLTGGRPFTATAYVERTSTGAGSAEATRIEARLWYRGHAKAKPCPLGGSPSQYIEYQFDRPRYAAPTVEVRGTDTIRGAVLFVFDCSRSMRGANLLDGKRELGKVLGRLWQDAGPSLKVGLMTYGTRTDVAKREYNRGTRRESPGLSPAGLAAQTANPTFMRNFPHPDGDVETLVPLSNGNAEQAIAKLQTLNDAKCLGFTPLYYATTQAIEAALRDAADQPARRVVVVSDGVNMPYDSDYYEPQGNQPERYVMGRTGQDVDQDDYLALDSALTRARDTMVTLQLFGDVGPGLLQQQLAQLRLLERKHKNFFVREVRPQQIADDILSSFPKTQIELRAERGTSEPQTLVLNKADPVRDWDSTGYLRREHLRKIVRLTLPGEERSLEKPLDLLGGERVVMSYDAGAARLTFDDDELQRRGSGTVSAPRASDSLKLLLDALDPERVGATVRKLRFRIRDEDRSARLAPRPKHVWLEIRPRGGGSDAEGKAFPCLDAAWLDNINLPRLEAPVERWPDAPSAHVTAYFRYDDPAPLQKTTVQRDAGGKTVTIEREAWRIENVVGDSDSVRKVVVVWQPGDTSEGMEKLLQRAVWASPPPDHTRRRYAVDGSEVVHEFTYTQPELVKRDIEISVVSRATFTQGAYSTEFEFGVAN